MVKQFLKERLGTIIFLLLVAILVVWGFFTVNQARQNAITYNEGYEAPADSADLLQEGSYVSIAKTDSLELFYNETRGAIQVKDLKSGYLWKSLVDDEVYDMDSLNKYWTGHTQSAILITYNNLKKRDAAPTTSSAGTDCKSLKTEYIEGGVAVEYGFTTPGIYVTIEYTLEDDQLVVRVPVEKIREESIYALSTIELLPYFGASDDNVDGYLFYPDGSGAITTYEKVNTRPSNVMVSFYYTYTNRVVDTSIVWDEDSYDQYIMSMPVFGIKNGNNALFAAVSEGEENSGLAVYASGNVLNLNRAGFQLYTRNIFNTQANSISAGSGVTNSAGTIQRVDKQLIPEDKEIRYFFLSGDQANYSGMANVYRNYLLDEGLLKASDKTGSDMQLALQLLMGTTKDGMVFDEYITMTDFDQVQEILDRLTAAGVSSTQLVLEAGQKNYDNFDYWGPARQLGGTGGLKDLNKYLESHSGLNAYLGVDSTNATSKTSGLTEDEDVAYNGLNVEIAGSDFDGLDYFLLNPGAAFRRNANLLDKLEGYGSTGIAYETAGKYAYPDYNINDPYTKPQAVNKIREMLAASQDTGRGIAVQGSNQYTYSYADYLYKLREDSYGLNITDHSVPFVQMVVSGLIPYSTDGAGNLSYDLQTQKLKWIEYGSLPYFYLTYESALNLRDTDYDELFSSTYADWENTVVDTYLEFKQNLSGVCGQQMVSHEILSDDLIRVTYANGIKVYINYSNVEASADGVRVPAKDYLVVGGGER